MAIEEHELASALLAWRSRFEDGLIRWSPDGKSETRFAEHLASLYNDRHSEDLRQSVETFARMHPGFPEWVEAVLRPFSHALVFARGAPWIRPPLLTLWRQVTARVDPDALVAWRVANAPMDVDTTLSRLNRWGFYIGLSDHGFDRVIGRGLADIHVHFEASDPMPLLWLRLATGQVNVRELQFYSDKTLVSLRGDPSEERRRAEDRSILGQAVELRRGLRDLVGTRAAATGDRNSPAALLADERRLLCHAWSEVREHGDDALIRQIDQYLFVKGLFLRRHQQSAGRGPGLNRFRDFLDRGRTLGERRWKTVRNSSRNERFQRMLSLATEPEHLRIVELRIAPAESLQAWSNFFRIWERALGEFQVERGRKLALRFIVHFIRTPDARATRRLPMYFGALRARIDRQSALLHLFRHRCPRLARHIVGVDVANLERGCPPEIFVPYLRLLRGDRPSSQQLEHPASERWHSLFRRGMHAEPAMFPSLGLTYHVGEDFHHPIDGLRAISGLLRNLFRPGDRIGHGLAVGSDIRAFELKRGFAAMPRGLLLDDLVWLRREASEAGAWTGQLQAQGNHVIDDLCRRIYGQEWVAGILERALDVRFSLLGPFPATGEQVQRPPEEVLVLRETFEREVWNRRASFATGDQVRVLSLAEGFMPFLQSKVARAIRDHGVSVETNPTSNLVTGFVDDLGRHPFFSYRTSLNGQVITSINTDDPGVFGTRIDIEFGLMFEAMLEQGIDRHTCLEILEAARRTAFEHAFGEGQS